LTSRIDCRDQSTRQINQELRQAIAAGERDIHVLHPEARHNLAVALLQPVRVVFEGSVGYYVAGMMDGAHVEVRGSTGWGAAESMTAVPAAAWLLPCAAARWSFAAMRRPAPASP